MINILFFNSNIKKVDLLDTRVDNLLVHFFCIHEGQCINQTGSESFFNVFCSFLKEVGLKSFETSDW